MQNLCSIDNLVFEVLLVVYWLGMMKFGNDVFVQFVIGVQGFLLIGVIVGGIVIVLLLLFGVFVGYLGGWCEDGFVLIMNVMIVIFGLLFMMVIVFFVLQCSWQLVVFVFGIMFWVGVVYVLWLQICLLCMCDYVYVLKVVGEKLLWVIFVEIMFNLFLLLMVQFFFVIIFVIFGEVGLFYLGFGLNLLIMWGFIFNDVQFGQVFGCGVWWWFILLGIMIVIFGVGLVLINFVIDEVINLKLCNVFDVV